MKYNGIITRCAMENRIENELPKLKIWVILSSVKTVVIETCATFADLAMMFGLTLFNNCLLIEGFVGKRCKIKYEEDTYSFGGYN